MPEKPKLPPSYSNYIRQQLTEAIPTGRHRVDLLMLSEIDPATTITKEQINGLCRNGIISPRTKELFDKATVGGKIHPGTMLEILESTFGSMETVTGILKLIKDNI